MLPWDVSIAELHGAHEAHVRTLEDKRGRITTSPDHPDLALR